MIFNVDLSNSMKTTDYGLSMHTNPFPTFDFRLHHRGTIINYSNLTTFTLNVKFERRPNLSYNYQLVSSVETINGEKFIRFNVPNELYESEDTLIIRITNRYNSVTTVLADFKVMILDKVSDSMNTVFQAVERFNQSFQAYFNAVKRYEINQPLGVVGLDNQGKISESRLPDVLGNHIYKKIINERVHGLGLTVDKLLEYYHNDDDEWYIANQIHGGRLSHDNRSGNLAIYGGDFITMLTINGGVLGDNTTNIVSGGTLGDDTSEFLDLTYTVDMGTPIYGGKF